MKCSTSHTYGDSHTLHIYINSLAMHICMYVCIEYRMSMMCECTCAHVCLYVAQMVGAGSRDHHVNTVQIIYISCVCVYIIAICSKRMNYLSRIRSTKGSNIPGRNSVSPADEGLRGRNVLVYSTPLCATHTTQVIHLFAISHVAMSLYNIISICVRET